MTVRVEIPIKVRVDPEALTERYSDLQEAITLATRRALENSRKVVLETRGGYMSVKFHDPEISWTGEGLTEVSMSVRDDFEEWLTNFIPTTVTEMALVPEIEASTPLSQDHVETLEQDRYTSLLAMYSVPSYENEGDSEAIPVTNIESVSQSAAPEWGYSWRTINSEEEFRAAFNGELEVLERSAPSTGYFGTIFQWSDGNKYVIVWQMPNFQLIARAPLSPLFDYQLQGEGTQARFQPIPATLPPRATYRLRWLHNTQSEEDKRQGYLQFFGPYIERQIRARAQQRGNILPESFEQQLEARVEQVVTEMLRNQFPAGTVCLLELTINGLRYLLHSGIELPQDLDTELIALIDFGIIEPPTEGGGGDQGEGESTSQGDGNGDGSPRRQGGFVVTGGGEVEQRDPNARLYPASRYTRSGTQDCSSLLGEPSLEELGGDGEFLRELIGEIAYKLQISPCEHAGRFCVNAAMALGSRGSAVADYASSQPGFTQPVSISEGNLGLLEFVPTASPAIQFMRHLAGITPLISRLSRAIQRVYRKTEHRHKIQGVWRDDPLAWNLHFLIELSPAMEESVGFLFVFTSQIIFLQLLRASAEAINVRLARFSEYAPLFEQLVRSQLTEIHELERLRNRLKEELPSPGRLASVGEVAFSTWRDARQGVIDLLSGNNPFGETEEDEEIVRRTSDNQVIGIRDGDGFVWTIDQLESALAIRKGTAQGIDPLVQQIIEVPEVKERFRNNPNGIQNELRILLTEMQTNNQEILNQAKNSPFYAFRASKIQEHLPSRTIPYTSFALQGIHLQVHEQIGSFFQGDRYYAEGVNYLFGSELGRQGLLNFFEFTGVLLLAVICAPAAFLVGGVLAIYHHQEALERQQIFQSLIDPNLVLSMAEVEAELFATELGLLLSFIPEIGSILRTGTVGVRSVARQGLVRGTRVASRYLRRNLRQRISRQMAQQLKYGWELALAKEFLQDQLIEEILNEFLIEPTIERIYQEFAQINPPNPPTNDDQSSQNLRTREISVVYRRVNQENSEEE